MDSNEPSDAPPSYDSVVQQTTIFQPPAYDDLFTPEPVTSHPAESQPEPTHESIGQFQVEEPQNSGTAIRSHSQTQPTSLHVPYIVKF